MLLSKVIEKDVPWRIEETTHLCNLIIKEDAEILPPEGKYIILTVNGIGKQLKPGIYRGDVVVSVSDVYRMPPHSLMRFNQISKDFHQGAVICDQQVIANQGVPAILQGGTLTGTEANDIYIASEEESFNGILITGEGEYTINNAQMDFEGIGANDFMGVGAGVACIDRAKVILNNCRFHLSGVTRCAVHVGGESEVTIRHCTLINMSPESDFLGEFSWAVGFRGTNRLAQLCDSAKVRYENCTLLTNGWGILSIDGTEEPVEMIVKDSTLELFGPRAHGYGAFCIGDNHIVFDHVTARVFGYPMLLMGMEGEGRAEIINGSEIEGRRFGAMVIDDDNSVFTIRDSAFHTEKSALVIKGSATLIRIENTTMASRNGVLVQLMDPDESGMDVQDFKIPVGVVDVPLSDRDLTFVSATEDVTIEIAHCSLKGNIFNSTTNIRAYRLSDKGGLGRFHDLLIGPLPPHPGPTSIMERHNGDDLKGPKNLGLTFTDVKLEGVISSATQAYREGLNYIDEVNRDELSNITQTAAPTVNNGVVLSLDASSVWTVTGTSYLSALTIADGARIIASSGKRVTFFVNGAEMEIKQGSYYGKLVLFVDPTV